MMFESFSNHRITARKVVLLFFSLSPNGHLNVFNWYVRRVCIRWYVLVLCMDIRYEVCASVYLVGFETERNENKYALCCGCCTLGLGGWFVYHISTHSRLRRDGKTIKTPLSLKLHRVYLYFHTHTQSNDERCISFAHSPECECVCRHHRVGV